MKKIVLLSCLCVYLFSLPACKNTLRTLSSNKNNIKGSGNVITEKRQISGFSQLQVSQGINVYIESGKSDYLKVYADDNLIPYIQTEVSGKTLTVKLKEGINIRSCKHLDVYVKMKQIESLIANSAADISGTTPFTLNDLKIEATSASNISIELSAQNIQVSATSAADITLKGKTESLQGTVTSGADLTASKLNTRSCEIHVTSGADASVNVSDVISYSVTSGADLNCKGHPRITKSNVNSGGNVSFTD